MMFFDFLIFWFFDVLWTSSQNWSFTTSFIKSASCGLINDTLGRKLQLWLLCENDRIYGCEQVAVLKNIAGSKANYSYIVLYKYMV